MLKNILFQMHWILGITLGTVMAVAGLTGGLISFDDEISSLFSGAPKVVAQGSAALTPEQIYGKARTAYPTHAVSTITVFSDPTEAARVSFVNNRMRGGPGMMQGMGGEGGMMMEGMGGEGGPGGPGGAQYVDPYTGEMLPQPGATARAFFRTTENIHRGMWAGRDTTIGSIVQGAMGWGALLLLLMIPTGLYLRWPKGINAWKLKTWFAVNTKAKGHAFLFSMHAVVGTFVLVVYLVSAHTGTMISREMEWYANSVRSAAGLPTRGPPPGEQGGPGQGGQGQMTQNVAPTGPDLSATVAAAWQAFKASGHAYASATLSLPGGRSQTTSVKYTVAGEPATEVTTLAFDAYAGTLTVDNTAPAAAMEEGPGGEGGPGGRPNETFWQSLIGGSQDVHTGRYFGLPGQLVMGSAGLMMPLLFITGWMMYLDRRRRKHEKLAKAAAKAASVG